MFLTLLAVSLLAVSQVAGVCTTTGLQCVGRDLYQQCPSVPNGPVFRCNSGQVCSTVDPTGRICVPQPPACEPGQDGAFRFPDGSCDSYYICVNNGLQTTQFIGYCATGFEFNLRLLRCVRPLESGCRVPEPTTPTVITDAPTTPTTITTIITDIPPSEGTTDPTVTTTPPPTFTCPSIGLHADVTSCRQYYRCMRTHHHRDLVFARYTCPIILPHFDPVRRTCWYFTERCVPQCSA